MNGAGGTIWVNGRISGMQMRQGDWCAILDVTGV